MREEIANRSRGRHEAARAKVDDAPLPDDRQAVDREDDKAIGRQRAIEGMARDARDAQARPLR